MTPQEPTPLTDEELADARANVTHPNYRSVHPLARWIATIDAERAECKRQTEWNEALNRQVSQLTAGWSAERAKVAELTAERDGAVRANLMSIKIANGLKDLLDAAESRVAELTAERDEAIAWLAIARKDRTLAMDATDRAEARSAALAEALEEIIRLISGAVMPGASVASTVRSTARDAVARYKEGTEN